MSYDVVTNSAEKPSAIRRHTRGRFWLARYVVYLVVVILFVRFFVILPRNDPVYNNKDVAHWFEQLLNSRTSEEREPGSEAFRTIGSAAVPYLVEVLRTKDSAIKHYLIAFLRQHRLPTAHLAERLHFAEERYVEVGNCLSLIGEEGQAAVPSLVKACKDPNPVLRVTAVSGLGDVGRDVSSVLPALIGSLKDPDKSVRAEAADALGKLGHRAETAIPALTRLTEDADPAVRMFASKAVEKIKAELKPLKEIK